MQKSGVSQWGLGANLEPTAANRGSLRQDDAESGSFRQTAELSQQVACALRGPFGGVSPSLGRPS